MKTRVRLLLIAGLLIAGSLLSTAVPVVAQCPEYCWIVDEYTACCYTESCDIIC
jgi:hypothetical protein